MAVVVASIPTFSIEEEDNLDAFIDRLIGYYNAIGVNPNGAGGGPPIGDRAMGILRGCLNTSRNNPIRPIFKLPKGGRKLVECLPIIIKKIGKFGIAEFYISPATCQKFDIND